MKRSMSRPAAACGIALAAWLVASAAPAGACSCIPESSVAQFERASDVFVAQVVAAPEAESKPAGNARAWAGTADHAGDALVAVDLDATETLKGTASGHVRIETPAEAAACGYAFHPGDRVLVFAKRTPRGLITDLCLGTTPAAGAEAELSRVRAEAAFLRGHAAPQRH
jgi:hypothetical protein